MDSGSLGHAAAAPKVAGAKRAVARRNDRAAQAADAPAADGGASFTPTAAQRRIADAALDLSFATDSPTAAQIASVLGVSRQAVAKQLVSPPFCAWLDSELRRLAGRQRALARAKFAYLAMSGSIERFKALGW